VLGQASGSYVGPKTWAVFLIAAATSILVTRPALQQEPAAAAPAGPVFRRLRPRLRLAGERA
jgi:hypothetical protein